MPPLPGGIESIEPEMTSSTIETMKQMKTENIGRKGCGVRMEEGWGLTDSLFGPRGDWSNWLIGFFKKRL